MGQSNSSWFFPHKPWIIRYADLYTSSALVNHVNNSAVNHNINFTPQLPHFLHLTGILSSSEDPSTFWTQVQLLIPKPMFALLIIDRSPPFRINIECIFNILHSMKFMKIFISQLNASLTDQKSQWLLNETDNTVQLNPGPTTNSPAVLSKNSSVYRDPQHTRNTTLYYQVIHRGLFGERTSTSSDIFGDVKGLHRQ